MNSAGEDVDKVKEADEPEEPEEMTMSSLMDELYFQKRIVNSTDVSVQSAFICILHLANEKGLEFQQDKDREQRLKEADFKIVKAKAPE